MPRRPPRHDHDAGGDPDVLDAKARLRHEVWDALQATGASRFPGALGRIPNFIGAEAAAERLRDTTSWRAAATLKANPDSPQLPVRQRALEDGKRVFMAVPRLAEREPFFLLDPATLTVKPRAAASISGAAKHGTRVLIEQLDPVDLVIAGCVAVDESGGRLGKGGGFSDLEFAVATEAGLVDDHTIVATTVHEVQVVADGRIPVTDHDVRLDLVVTPERVIEIPRRDGARNAGLMWEQLTDEKIAAIPLLAELRMRGATGPRRRR